MKNRRLRTLWGLLFLGMVSGLWGASWGDAEADGLRESASTGTYTSARLAFDQDQSSAWQLTSGSTKGWLERYWAAPRRLASAIVVALIPEGVTLQLSTLVDGHWVPVRGASMSGPLDGSVKIVFPGDLRPTERVLLTTEGPHASEALVREVSFTDRSGGSQFGKIVPVSSTFNIKESINLKASRLWDGIIGNAWYEPMWDIPWEVQQTGTADKPTEIFPTYLGHPHQDGEIVWDLGGTFQVRTVKANFLQAYRSVRFQFGDGTRWDAGVELGVGWADWQAGWKRADLAVPATATKIRITFPGGWERARFLGELEVWGSGTTDKGPRALVVPTADPSGRVSFNLDGTDPATAVVEVRTSGKRSTTLAGQVEGKAFSVSPWTWSANETIYRVEVPGNGTRFFGLDSPGSLRGVEVIDGADRGELALGWPWNDGRFEQSEADVVPLKTKEWSLGKRWQLERLRVYTGASTPGTFRVGTSSLKQVVWTNQGAGWWEADLGGIEANRLTFTASNPIVLDEVRLWGTSLEDTRVGLEVWWPRTDRQVTSAAWDGNSVIGWQGDPSVQVKIDGASPRQADKLFWMPLNQLRLSPGQEKTLAVRAVQGTAQTELSRTVSWKGTVSTSLDQGSALSSINSDSLVLSGTVSDSTARVFVQGVEVPLAAGRFSSSTALNPGFQNLRVEIWNRAKTTLIRSFTKPVLRTVDAPDLWFDLPAGDLWTQMPSLKVTGRVGPGVGLSLGESGKAVPLTGRDFELEVPLEEGPRTLNFTVTDGSGGSRVRNLEVQSDRTAPVVTVEAPASEAYLDSSVVLTRFRAGEDGLWWLFNGGTTDTGKWESTPEAIQERIYRLADGHYTHTVRVQDRSGNRSPVVSYPFWVDTTPPESFTIAANVTGWTNNNRPTLTFATTDKTTGVDRYEYAVDQDAFVRTTSPLRLPTLEDGIRMVYVKAIDRSGNVRLETIELRIDTSLPPMPTGLLPVPGEKQIEPRWVAIDDGESYQDFEVEREPSWPDGYRSPGLGYGKRTLLDAPLTNGEVFRYRLRAVDRAGNRSAFTEWEQATVGVASIPVSPESDTVVDFDRAVITMPPGATDPEIVRIQIQQSTQTEAYESAPNVLVSPIFQFRVVRSVGGVESVGDHADFLEPLQVEITYDPAKIPSGLAEGDLKPFYYDEVWGVWMPIEGAVVNPETNELIFETNHFTDFSVQATDDPELTPQEIRDSSFSPTATKVGHDPVSASPQSGVVSTGFTEAILPGKAGFDLVLNRVYDTATAQTPLSSLSASTTDSAPSIDGSRPWLMGFGWKFAFPFLKVNNGGLWLTGPDGVSLSFDQASITSAEHDDTVWLENHEGSDSRLKLEFKNDSDSYKGFRFAGAVLFMKDGRQVFFDSRGRVVKMNDSSRTNEVKFSYVDENTALKTPKKIIVTDSMLRTVEFVFSSERLPEESNGQPGEQPFVHHVLRSISVQSGTEVFTCHYIYYPEGMLKRATDIGGRVWDYGYTQLELKKEASSSTPASAIFSWTKTPFVLSKVSGPGIGTTTVAYDVIQTMRAKGGTKLTLNRPMGKSVETYLGPGTAGESPMRRVSSTYVLKRGEADQFFVAQATVDDGRTTSVTVYGHNANGRKRLSKAPEALREGFGFVGPADAAAEEVTFVQSVTVTSSLDGHHLETIKQTWDPGKMRLTQNRIERSSTHHQETNYEYDTWGNTIKSSTASVSGGQTQTNTEEYRYYEESKAPDTQTLIGKALGAESLSFPEQRSLVAAMKRTASGSVPSGTSTVQRLTVEQEYYSYTPEGRLESKNVWLGGQSYASTGYEYHTDGRIKKTTTPGLTTSYAYADGLEGVNRVTTTQESVDLGLVDRKSDATNPNLISVQDYSLLLGNNVRTKDPQDAITLREFDALGRPTKISEPAEAAGTAVTMIEYDDSALTSKVTAPLGLVTTYDFDPLGRLVSVSKQEPTPLGAPSAPQAITTKMAYDPWDQVTSVWGPFREGESDDQQQDGLFVKRTRFAYDERGRVTSITKPLASASAITVYNDAAGTAVSRTEEGRVTETQLDWGGRVQRLTRYGPGVTYNSYSYYDGQGRSLAAVDAEGQTTTTTYNTRGLVDTIKLPSRNVSDSAGNLTSVSPETVRTYDESGYLTAETQRVGTTGRTVNRTVNGLGWTLATTASVTVAGANKVLETKTEFDKVGKPKKSVSGYQGASEAKREQSWTYDLHGRVLSETDGEGQKTTYTYDREGHRTSVIDPRQTVLKVGTSERKYSGTFQLDLTYNSLGRLVSAALPSQSDSRPTLEFSYDGRGNLKQRAGSDGQLIKYEYNERNLRTSETTKASDSVSYQTTYTYDGDGRVVGIQAPGREKVERRYDSAGRLAAEGNDTLGWTRSTYDGLDRPKEVKDGRGGTTKYEYDPEGRVTKVTDPRNYSRVTLYEGWGNPVREIDGEGNLWVRTFDELGRPVSEALPWGKATSSQWDAWSSVTQRTDARGNTFTLTYDKVGRLTKEASGTWSQAYAYDEAGDVISATDGGITTLYNHTSGIYRPDPYGLVRAKSETVAGRSLTMGYGYDNSQRLTSVTTPDNATVSYGYTHADQLSTVSGWITQAMGYGDNGLLSGWVSNGGPAKTLRYDRQGRLSSMTAGPETAPLRTYSYTYDLAGNIVAKNANRYGYDAANQLSSSYEQGRLEKRPESLSASYLSVDRDEDGNKDTLIQLGPESLVSLDAANRSIEVDLGRNYPMSRLEVAPSRVNHRVKTRDIRLFVRTEAESTYRELKEWDAEIDDRGVIQVRFWKAETARYVKVNTIWDDRDEADLSVETGATFSNVVSKLVRVWALSDYRSTDYTYDSAGNRTSIKIDGLVQTYTYYKNSKNKNLPLLASDGEWKYIYDANGNLLKKAKSATLGTTPQAFASLDASAEYWDYTWDMKNRLAGVSRNGVALASYQYNGENLRVASTVRGKTTVYAYGRGGALAYREELSGTARTYTYAGSTVVGWKDKDVGGTQRTYWAITDHLGSVTGVVDSNGTEVWRSEYDSFGGISGADIARYDFDGSYAGHEVEPETGLIYMWNRWQDPTTGRFISEDPARDGNNWYAYVGNNPINRWDPTGLDWVSDVVDAVKDFFSGGGGGGDGSEGSSGRGSDEKKNAPAPAAATPAEPKTPEVSSSGQEVPAGSTNGLTDFFSELAAITNDPILLALLGDPVSQGRVGGALVQAGQELAGNGAEIASNVALAANGATILGIATGDIPLATAAGTVSLAADITGLGLSALSGNGDKITGALVSVGLDATAARLTPVWNAAAERFIDVNSGRFVPTSWGKQATAAAAATSILTGKVVEGIQENTK